MLISQKDAAILGQLTDNPDVNDYIAFTKAAKNTIH